MQNYELKLTDENILQTYLDNSIGRNDDIFRFAYILNNIEDSCSIAIEGDWGSGKSFFVKQLKMFLDANNPCIVSDKDMNDKIKLKLQKSNKMYNYYLQHQYFHKLNIVQNKMIN